MAKSKAYEEVVRLEKKTKESQLEILPMGPQVEDSTETPFEDFPDQPYTAFEWLLTEHGAPDTNYFWSMYASRAGYCDVLQSDIQKMEKDVVARDPILTAIAMYVCPEYDGIQG